MFSVSYPCFQRKGMMSMAFSRGELITIDAFLMKELYFWKYKELKQKAKKQNPPYIKAKYTTENEFREYVKKPFLYFK